MKLPIGKFSQLERSLSETRGEFTLFALVLREDAIDKWDFLVAAPWIEKNKWFAYRHLSNQVAEILSKPEMVMLSRIVIIEAKNPMLSAVQSAFNIRHGVLEVQNSNIFGLQIKHAYFITSQRIETKTV